MRAPREFQQERRVCDGAGSRGTLDPYKKPNPFVVEFDGQALPAEPENERRPIPLRDRPHRLRSGDRAQRRQLAGDLPLQRQRRHRLSRPARPLVSLDTSGGPTVTNNGKTFAYNLMRGTLTVDGVNVFAGFHPSPDNDEFGCVSVEFTVH